MSNNPLGPREIVAHGTDLTDDFKGRASRRNLRRWWPFNQPESSQRKDGGVLMTPFRHSRSGQQPQGDNLADE